MADDAGALRELLDQAAIRGVIERYFYCLDRKVPARLSEVFTPDAAISFYDGARRTTGEKVIAGGALPARWSSHALSNTCITVDGDTATADSYAIATLAYDGEGDAPGRVVTRGLQYLDKIARRPEGWRIVDRAHIPLWEMESEGRTPSGPGALRGRKD